MSESFLSRKRRTVHEHEHPDDLEFIEVSDFEKRNSMKYKGVHFDYNDQREVDVNDD